MLVILSAMGGLLESDVRDVREDFVRGGRRYRVPIMDLDIDFWRKRDPEDIPPVRIAAFEYRGRSRSIDGKWVDILELVDYPEKS